MYRVMIVEDEMLVRIGLKSMLNWEQLGMTVIADVSNGKEALEAYTTQRPDILITDLRMPVMDGLTLIRKIREQDKQLIIIILTCLDEFSLAQEALSLGVSNYILKLTMSPEEIEQILVKCRETLDKRHETSIFETQWIDRNLIKGQMLDDFLLYKSLPVDVFASFVNHSRMRLSEDKLCLVIMQLPDYKSLIESSGDTRGRKFCNFLLGVLDKVFTDYNRGEAYCDYKSEYILLFSFGDVEHARIPSLINEILYAVKDAITHFIGADAYFGVSSIQNGYHYLPELRIEALKALEQNVKNTLPLKIDAALSYMNAHYQDDISLETVADYAGVTPNYLSYLFTHTVGESFIDTINKIRIEHAKIFLSDHSKTVYMVGEQVGFTNTTYFIRVFKKHTGMTPNEYRNNLKR
ncbi:MAG TPA: response regulator [Clostridiales bacterium]|nr:response regulator [Clostridiales bacterium]